MIKVKLYSLLRENRGKEVEFEYTNELTCADIVESLKIPLKDVSIIICNDYDNTPEVMLEKKPNDNTVVHIFPPMAGG